MTNIQRFKDYESRIMDQEPRIKNQNSMTNIQRFKDYEPRIMEQE